MTRFAAAALAAGWLLAAGGAAAFNDPDWPCIQRKVVHLSVGQMWTAPIPEDREAWRRDPELVELAGRIAARRTPMAEVEAMLQGIGEGPLGDRRARLTALYMGVFDLIDAERARLVDGIVRFALKQRALAELIDAEQVALAQAEAAVAPDDFDRLDELEARRDKVVWDTRIYDERRRSMLYVCESPVLLEQRAFAVGRMVQAMLEAG